MNKKVLVGSLVAVAVLVGGASITWAVNNDYSVFRSFMKDRATQVTETNFNQFTEMHQKIADGDYAGAKQIKTELGLNKGRGQCGGCGLHKGQEGSRKCDGRGNGSGFVDSDNNGVCDFSEGLK